MKMRFEVGHVALALSLMTTACVLDEEVHDDEDFGDEIWGDEEIGETEQASLSTNGMSLNGMSLNGMSLNGMSLNGMSLNGMSLNGMSLNGTSLSGVTINGSQLTGVKSGATVAGTALIGTRMTGTLSNGGTLTLRIDSAQVLPAPNNDVWAYGVSYALSGGTWAPLCGSSSTLAIPLSGTWNQASGVIGGGSWTASSTSFTFGCRGTALAKCVELGYKPWKTVGGVLLRNHHQACTRMIRADYCGDGKAWTTDGTPINVYDKLNIQTDASTIFRIDAEWLPTGARCVHILRDFQSGKPTCHATKVRSDCGTFANGALIINEYKPAGTTTSSAPSGTAGYTAN